MVAQRKKLFVADDGADTVAVYAVDALLSDKEELKPVRTVEVPDAPAPLAEGVIQKCQPLAVAHSHAGRVEGAGEVVEEGRFESASIRMRGDEALQFVDELLEILRLAPGGPIADVLLHVGPVELGVPVEAPKEEIPEGRVGVLITGSGRRC
ncbi:hypothetical protein [Corallococcus sp. EGB]|uniref:hypothetical protein n=1 Tax=Corallococcus sp. EGB TaxID=1521117 RepID=UPI001CBF5D78|nr:hypothetical protein [Corallococcus sp. EGB]